MFRRPSDVQLIPFARKGHVNHHQLTQCTMSDYLIGGSPAIRRIKASLKKLAADPAPLVITGEPGVGKSLLSSRIHAHSPMSDRPIEFINFRTFTERDQRIRLLGGCPPELPSSRQSILETPTTVVLKHLDCATRFLQEQLTMAILAGKIYRLGVRMVSDNLQDNICFPGSTQYDVPQRTSQCKINPYSQKVSSHPSTAARQA